MNQTETVTVTRFFDTVDICHYEFSVSNQTLEPYNRKWLQIYVDQFDGLDIFIGNSSDIKGI